MKLCLTPAKQDALIYWCSLLNQCSLLYNFMKIFCNAELYQQELGGILISKISYLATADDEVYYENL